MRLSAVVGDLRQVLAAEVRAGERAAMSTIRAETDQVKGELRKQVTGSLGGNARGIANAWRSQIFPRSGQSLRPAGLVWTKVPAIIDAFERGAVIRAKGGRKFLAIPTGFNAARGRRGRGEKGMRVTPAQMVASGQAFLRPFKSGRGFVWCLPLYEAQGIGRGRRRGRRTQLIAGGVTEIGTGNRKGREAWARGMLERGMVPMFLLLPQVAGAAPAARNALLDALLVAIGNAITAHRTLGGAVEWAQPGSPEFQDTEFEGASAARTALVPVTLWFTTAGSALA